VPRGFTSFVCLRPPRGAVGVFVILDRLRTPPDASLFGPSSRRGLRNYYGPCRLLAGAAPPPDLPGDERRPPPHLLLAPTQHTLVASGLRLGGPYRPTSCPSTSS